MTPTPADGPEYFGRWQAKRQQEKWAGCISLHYTSEYRQKHARKVARWKRNRTEREKFHVAAPI